MGLKKLFWLPLVLALFLAACGGQTAEAPAATVEGPALVMFYTDN
jgi:ABC-type glycerol-3-phosphate transport system substrate-binding protein